MNPVGDSARLVPAYPVAQFSPEPRAFCRAGGVCRWPGAFFKSAYSLFKVFGGRLCSMRQNGVDAPGTAASLNNGCEQIKPVWHSLFKVRPTWPRVANRGTFFHLQHAPTMGGASLNCAPYGVGWRKAQ